MQHLRFNRVLVVVTALALMIFAVAAYAQDDNTSAIASFGDGRVNSLDIAAPVAVYDYYVYPYTDDLNLGVLDTIQLWGFTPSASIDKVLEISRADILNTQVTSGTSALLASNLGYSVYKEANGSLTVVAPADATGSAYQFNWTPGL